MISQSQKREIVGVISHDHPCSKSSTKVAENVLISYEMRQFIEMVMATNDGMLHAAETSMACYMQPKRRF